MKHSEVCLPSNNDPHADPLKMPRSSSPVSFLKKRAYLVALSFIALVASPAVASTDCVCDFDANKDYFPVKLDSDYAEHFDIEYFKSYKKITIRSGGNEYVTYAYLCGTPKPEEATEENAIQIPINSAVATSTTLLPYFDYIGQRTSLMHINSAADVLPKCYRKLYDDGVLLAGSGVTSVADAVKQLSNEKTNAGVDVVFTDSWSYSTDYSALGSNVKKMMIPQQAEANPLGVLEWLEPVAALYNVEGRARYTVDNINARYKCVMDRVKANPPAVKKKVLWGSFYNNTWAKGMYSVGSCPNYYCDLIEAAGAEFLSPSPESFQGYYLNETEFLKLATQADIWLYMDGNFDELYNGNSPFFVGDRVDTFKDLPIIQNKMVFDILGGFLQDWFDYRIAEPDVILMDIVQALYANEYISEAREKDFLRNVFTEDPASQEPRKGSECADVNELLYTGWLEGPCATSGVADNVPPIVPVLCASAGSLATASPFVFVTFVVMAVMQMFAL